MKRLVIAASLLGFALLACQSAPSPIVLTAAPPTATGEAPTPTAASVTPTPEPPTTGISGTVKYTGTKSGSIMVFVTTEAVGAPTGAGNMKNFPDVSGGEFEWSLPAGSYYVAALMQVEGPASITFPFITCGPIDLKPDVLLHMDIVLTDADMYGKPRDCPTTGS